MKRNAALAVLLAATIAATGLMVYYNLALRESFAVTVGYSFPAPEPAPKPASKPAGIAAEQYLDEGEPEESEEYSEQGESFPDEEEPEAVRFPLELNAATYDELLLIPQVGDVMAQRILQYRDHLGGYTSLSQLREIKGVGDKVFAVISAYLYVSEEYGATLQEEEPS